MANFKYKLIFKILTDRLSFIFASLISPGQKGFIAGRSIKDGICLTFEAINLLNNKSFNGNVDLKIDISKAFNSLGWEFMLKTLSCFGFSVKLCNWIHTIFYSATISISFNGKQIGYFYCSNEVRQGDPLSHLLFCFAKVVLSRSIVDLVKSNNLNLIQANRHCKSSFSHFICR